MPAFVVRPISSSNNYNWLDPAIWAGRVVPNAPDADVYLPVVIRQDGTVYPYSVYLSVNDVFSVRSLDVAQPLSITSGNSGGPRITFNVGAAITQSSTLTFASATVSAASITGKVDLTLYDSLLDIGQIAAGASIVARGGASTINATSIGANAVLIAAMYQSAGSLTISAPLGGIAGLSGSSWVNGVLQSVTAGSKLVLDAGTLITGLSGSAVLSAGSIWSVDPLTRQEVNLTSSLRTIDAAGELQMIDSPYAFTDLSVAGKLHLISSFRFPYTVLSGDVSTVAGGLIYGSGVIADAVHNDGIIRATPGASARYGSSNGLLVIDGAITGSGALEIGPRAASAFGQSTATLALNAAISQDVFFLDTVGQLTLNAPASFTGRIAPISTGDAIVLSDIALSSVTGTSYAGNAAGGTLTIQQAGGNLTLGFIGDFSAGNFVLTAGYQPLPSDPASLVITVLDTAKPVLTALTLSNPDATHPFTTFTLGVDDPFGTPRSVLVAFRDGWTGAFGGQISTVAYAPEGGLGEGVKTFTAAVSQNTPIGRYEIDSVTLIDEGGNSAIYSTADLAAAGFSTGFDVTTSNVRRATLSAPATLIEGADRTFSISLTVKDATDFTGAIYIALAGAGASRLVASSSNPQPYTISRSAAGDLVLTLSAITLRDTIDVEPTQIATIQISAPGLVFANGSFASSVDIALLDGALIGTSGPDTLSGTVNADRVVGLAGNDVLIGLAGDDRLEGRDGDDQLHGGGGSNVLSGGEGRDTAIYDGLARSFAIDIGGDATLVRGEGINDTLQSTETITFRDASLTFDADSDAAGIMRLYNSVLRRAPDPHGFDGWLDFMADGHSLAEVAAQFLASAEFQAATGALSNADFVEHLYNFSLGRGSDAAGKAGWVANLDGGVSRATVLLGFSESTEHRAITQGRLSAGLWITDDVFQQVAALYDSFANRLPDAQGLIGWASELQSGHVTLLEVAQAFAASAEFTGRTAGLSNDQFVDLLYLNTLDRAPGAGEKAGWVGALDGGVDRGTLLLGFSESEEHYPLIGSSIYSGIEITI